MAVKTQSHMNAQPRKDRTNPFNKPHKDEKVVKKSFNENTKITTKPSAHHITSNSMKIIKCLTENIIQ